VNRRGLGRWATGLAITLATFTLMVATEPFLAIVWDEGYTLGREARLRAWSLALENPKRFAETWQPPAVELVQQVGAIPPRQNEVDSYRKLLFDPQVLAWFWPFAREEPHGHPPFYALVGLVGDYLTPNRADLPRARLGPMLIFSVTAGALFLFVSLRWGSGTGFLASGAWVLQPNLFGLGHYATYDAILASLWILALMAFAEALRCDPSRRFPRWGWVVAFGVLAGSAADTKLTGWFLPLPLFAWSLLYRDRRGLMTLAFGAIVAALVLYALNPPWWTAPIAGVERFVRSSLNRGKTIPIPVLFLGRVYNTPNDSLPWYNTLIWTVLVTPVGFLALAVAGLVRAGRRFRAEPVGTLIVGNWLFLLLLRALPHTPGHDGVRQFLPAFGVLALVASLGAASALERLGRWGRAIVAFALAEGALSVALMMPVPLSYFSPIVCGLPGAAALGMEPTYYWDALTADTLEWINTHPPTEAKVRFASYPTSMLYLRQTGQLRRRILPNEPGPWTWYVLQNRPGAFSPLDRELIRRNQPSHVVHKWGVPLVWIFPFDEVRAAEERLKRPFP
jgi:4-amino-4-deoxy-L-arabinose transferase-like glycosyltransferase